MSRISLAESPANEVELFGSVFTVRPPVRSILERADKAQEKVDAAGTPYEYAEALCLALDVRLEPAAGESKASTLLRKAFREDRLTVQQIEALIEDVVAQDRPT